MVLLAPSVLLGLNHKGQVLQNDDLVNSSGTICHSSRSCSNVGCEGESKFVIF